MPRLLRSRAARRRDSSPRCGRRFPRHRRPVWQWQVVAAPCRSLPALAGGVLPGSEGWRRLLCVPASGRWKSCAGCSCRERRILAPRPSMRCRPTNGFSLLSTSSRSCSRWCRSDTERAAFADVLPVPLLIRRAGSRGGRAARRLLRRFSAYPGLAELLGGNHVLVAPMQASELRVSSSYPRAVDCGWRPSWPTRSWTMLRVSRARCRCFPPPCSSCGRSGRATCSRWLPTASPAASTAPSLAWPRASTLASPTSVGSSCVKRAAPGRRGRARGTRAPPRTARGARPGAERGCRRRARHTCRQPSRHRVGRERRGRPRGAAPG